MSLAQRVYDCDHCHDTGRESFADTRRGKRRANLRTCTKCKGVYPDGSPKGINVSNGVVVPHPAQPAQPALAPNAESPGAVASPGRVQAFLDSLSGAEAQELYSLLGLSSGAATEPTGDQQPGSADRSPNSAPSADAPSDGTGEVPPGI